MTDVDAIRFLASEHDLEFVNLETYPVDADAAEILPEAVARRHHAVAVKRKFGTPVIAIANPDDVFTLDTLRASLGRDFISVVASREQIGELLDHLYGTAVDTTIVSEDALADGDETLGLSLYGSAFAPSEATVDEGPAPVEASSTAPEVPTFEPEPIVESNGNGHVASAFAEPLLAEDAVPSAEAEAAPELATEPEPVPAGDEAAAFAPVEDLLAEQSLPDLVAEVQADAVEAPARLPTPADDTLSLDPTEGSPDALAASADELAEFARAVQLPTVDSESTRWPPPPTSSTRRSPPSRSSTAIPTASHGLASSMPPLAKALVEGERVSLEDMESVIEEHDRTGHSIARILTTQKARHRGRPHVGHGPGDGPGVRRPRHRRR